MSKFTGNTLFVKSKSLKFIDMAKTTDCYNSLQSQKQLEENIKKLCEIKEQMYKLRGESQFKIC